MFQQNYRASIIIQMPNTIINPYQDHNNINHDTLRNRIEISGFSGFVQLTHMGNLEFGSIGSNNKYSKLIKIKNNGNVNCY